MYNAWVEFNSDVDGKEERVKETNKDMITRINAGAMADIGYKLRKEKSITFAAKYYYGFVDVYKDRSGTKNSSFFLEMAILTKME
jgi:hypothetical protein